MRAFGNLLIVLTITSLTPACTPPNPYHPIDGGIGYFEQKLEDDRYTVEFWGDLSTSKEMVGKFLLYRTAEVTLAKGYDGFQIVDRSIDGSTRYLSLNSDFRRSDRLHNHSHDNDHAVPGFGGYIHEISPITRYLGSIEMIMLKAPLNRDGGDVYDATQLIENLKNLVEPVEASKP